MRSLVALAIVLALAATADANRHRRAGLAPAEDPRLMLEQQIAAEQDTLSRTIATVADKLAAADATRLHRVRAAMRAIEAPLPADASDGDRMAAARRRAAARMLLERDGAERGLLADELARLRAGEGRIAAAAKQLVDLVLPGSLARPVAGSIARGFGPYEHDRSHATLVRHGIDFEVDDRAPVVAPADGIVRYAGPIRGLDHGAILDHGTYYTVVAKLGELALPVGAHVTKGDRLGRAAHHRVYLEVRVKVGPGGLPIDPEPLLAH